MERRQANQEVNFKTVKCCFGSLCRFYSFREVIEARVPLLSRVSDRGMWVEAGGGDGGASRGGGGRGGEREGSMAG